MNVMELISKKTEDKFIKLGGEYSRPASTHTGFWLFSINGQKISYYPNNDSRLFINGVCFGIMTNHEDALKLMTAFMLIRPDGRMFMYS